ncbi:hypothetical protein [Paenibacillus tyrfis]|uniref:hypothetical protein n=1 Tax=Paenibacillus tyrfis TaxID=1501230 RepID=UPI000B594F2B|nr:hypothetical protein [Paenibacillus tyrfis]
MNYTSKKVSLKQLRLDPLNPRFVNLPEQDEDSIKDYLVDYEDVLTIARGINEDEGLMPGERVIVYKEGSSYIVLEGNRRICACKLLSGILTTKKKVVPATAATLENIKAINVDVVDSRESVQRALFRRHISGIRGWATQAKLFFFASRFKKGETVDFIRRDTDTTAATVKGYIQRHNLLEYTLGLSNWTENEKSNIDRVALDVDRFLRVFNSVSEKYDMSAKELLRLSYDDKTLEPSSTLRKELFEEGLYILAKAAFLTDNLSTRKHVEHVADFVKYYEKVLVDEQTSQTEDGQESEAEAAAATETDKNESGTDGKSEGNQTNDDTSDATSSSKTDKDGETGAGANTGAEGGAGSGKGSGAGSGSGSKKADDNETPPQPVFFSALTWKAVQPTDPDEQGVAHLAAEIRKLSELIPNRREAFYERFPFAATIILRSLFEQSLKFYLKKMNKWDELIAYLDAQGGKKVKCHNCGVERKSEKKSAKVMDPSIGQILSFLRSNNNTASIFPEKKLQTAFNTATGHIPYMDTVVHTSEMMKPTKIKLDSIANDGLYSIVSYMLNTTTHWPKG